MLRAILFDFNGVLIDDEPLHLEAFAEALAEEGLALDRQVYLEEFFGRDDRTALRRFLAGRGERLDGVREARLLARKAAYYRRRLHSAPYPLRQPVVALALQLAAAGRTLGVVSGAARVEVSDALGVAGILDRLKVLVTAEDVERCKPDPAGYLLALDRLNSRGPLPERLLHPHEVAAIEDSPRGLAAAAAAGLVTFGLAAPAFPADLRQADRVLAESDLDLERLDALAAGLG
jgi:HAD superfamily hydrolase (TIGR01509 family)